MGALGADRLQSPHKAVMSKDSLFELLRYKHFVLFYEKAHNIPTNFDHSNLIRNFEEILVLYFNLFIIILSFYFIQNISYYFQIKYSKSITTSKTSQTIFIMYYFI